jgi:dephospho-CoA kinase
MTSYKVGLTGGIASGKSMAASLFSKLGVPIIDADLIARELVKPGRPALAEIVAAFGKEALATDGKLDRARLRKLIFHNEDLKSRLEAILHPRILQEMHRRAQRVPTPYCILVIPLLIETNQQETVDRVLVIDVPENIQRRRLQTRDGLSEAEIDVALRNQSTRAARLAAANDIIDNRSDVTALRRQIEHYHQKYLSLASQRICHSHPPDGE